MNILFTMMAALGCGFAFLQICTFCRWVCAVFQRRMLIQRHISDQIAKFDKELTGFYSQFGEMHPRHIIQGQQIEELQKAWVKLQEEVSILQTKSKGPKVIEQYEIKYPNGNSVKTRVTEEGV